MEQKYSKEDLERDARGETGFSVDIVYDCPHEVEHTGDISVGTVKKALSSNCSCCEEKDENWLCLKCGSVFCSRYKNAHMVKHNEESGHSIAVSLVDLSIWCYKCQSYIESPKLKGLSGVLSSMKYGESEKKKDSLLSGTLNRRPGSTSHVSEEEIKEHFDADEKVMSDAKKVAELIQSAKHVVVYTGAGISTSAKIPDYRGPKGIWTLKDKGISAPGIDIEQAYPTYAHYALKTLMDKDLLHYVVSTNVDGLHRRSGIPDTKISELHGNCYRETCSKCQMEYLRGFDVCKSVKNYRNHITGRLCDCGGALKDTIIHFGENLPQRELEDALKHSAKADLSIVLGTSMRVAPACKLPTLNKNGKLVIVNLQHTPYDKQCNTRIYSKTDEFLKYVMQYLGIHEVDMTTDVLKDFNQQKDLKGKQSITKQSSSDNDDDNNKKNNNNNESDGTSKILTLNPNSISHNITTSDNPKIEKDQNDKFSSYDLERESKGETGFSVDMVYNCPHEKDEVSNLSMSNVTNSFSSNCSCCEEKDENWLCLKCGSVFCSRYKNAHMVKHNEEIGHSIAISLVDLSIWCYKCYSYISSENLNGIVNVLNSVKFGFLTTKDSSSSSSSQGGSSNPL